MSMQSSAAGDIGRDISLTNEITQNLRVLVVDDEDLDRMAVRRMLEKSGLNVTMREAESASDAFDLIDSEDFDCVLLDYHLTDMDGDGVFKFIEAAGQENAPAVVFISGETNVGLARELIENGAVDFIDKNDLSAAALKRAILFALARRSRQQHLERSANFDGLTGLPGRTLFLELLGEAVSDSRRSEKPGALVIFEIARFKHLNEKFGSETADELLRLMSARLLNAIRDTDRVGRVSGDRFAVIGRNLNGIQAVEVFANKIMKALQLPYKLSGTDLFAPIKGGAAVFPSDAASAADLMRAAEIALQKGASGETGSVAYFDDSLGRDQERRQELQSDIERALQRDQISLEFQPMLECMSGELIAAEALLRWRHHVHGSIDPLDFLPTAETTGALIPISEWVVRKVAGSVAEWSRSLKRPLRCTLNLGLSDLRNGRLCDVLGEAIQKHNVSPSLVGVEISEEVLQRKDDHIVSELKTIHDLGVKLILDNYGDAQSSLPDVASIPFSMLKISRRLVLAISEDPAMERTIRAITSMAGTLGIRTVAVGVETEEQLSILRDCGVDHVQGFLLGSPASEKDFAAWNRKLPSLRKKYFAESALRAAN